MSIQSASAGSFRSSSPQRSIRFGHLADVNSRSVSSAFLRTPSGMSLRRGQTPAKASQNASIAASLPYKGPFDQLTVLWFRISMRWSWFVLSPAMQCWVVARLVCNLVCKRMSACGNQSGPNSRELQASAFDRNPIPEVAAPCQPVLHKGYNAGRSSLCVSKGTAKHAQRILLLRILALVMEAFR